MSEEGFTFNNSTGSEYDTENKCIKDVVFPTSPTGMSTDCLSFDEPVDVATCVAKVEEYLNEPLDRNYFRDVRLDLEDDNMENYTNRYECLGDNVFLEKITIKDGEATFHCGC